MKKKSRLEELKEKYPLQYQMMKIGEQVSKVTNPLREINAEINELKSLYSNKNEFNLNGDFSVLDYNGEYYFLSTMQSQAIDYMYNQHKKGKEFISQINILIHINTKQNKLHDVFKDKNIMGNIIKLVKHGYYKLDIDIK